MKNKIIKGDGIYWALLCHCSKESLICGVYPSLKEAKEVNEIIKDCPSKHSICRCHIQITLVTKKNEIVSKKINKSKNKNKARKILKNS